MAVKGLRAYWLNEDGTKTPTKPKYGLLKIHFKKLVEGLEANQALDKTPEA